MDSLVKIGIAFVSLVVMLIPTWLWLAIYKFASPEGFWQNLVLVGGGIWVFGGIQLVFLMFWVIVMVFMLTDKSK